MNYLEQLAAEWYQFKNYFVRTNVWVGPRPNGGYECELDVVAFHPGRKHLVHIEPSMDAHSWAMREKRFAKKFEAGRKYIPDLFQGLDLPDEVEQIALLGFASKQNHEELAGGEIMLVGELLNQILSELRHLKVASSAVPEGYPLLRTLQFVADNRAEVTAALDVAE